jgi:SAM-dependent methyltransferase
MSIWSELKPLTVKLHGVVADVGCGNGEYSRRLREEIPTVDRVVSIDKDPGLPMYAYGQDYRDNVTEFHQLDVLDLSSVFEEGAFDCVMAWHVIEHVEDAAFALAQLARVTKDLLFLATPIRREDGVLFDLENHVREWDEKEFCALVRDATGFEPIDHYVDSANCQNWLFKRMANDAKALDRDRSSRPKLAPRPDSQMVAEAGLLQHEADRPRASRRGRRVADRASEDLPGARS